MLDQVDAGVKDRPAPFEQLLHVGVEGLGEHVVRAGENVPQITQSGYATGVGGDPVHGGGDEPALTGGQLRLPEHDRQQGGGDRHAPVDLVGV